MSYVTRELCACGKKWIEESPECVFNYHPKPQYEIMRLPEMICGKCSCLMSSEVITANDYVRYSCKQCNHYIQSPDLNRYYQRLPDKTR
jgi:hypothetical protein